MDYTHLTDQYNALMFGQQTHKIGTIFKYRQCYSFLIQLMIALWIHSQWIWVYIGSGASGRLSNYWCCCICRCRCIYCRWCACSWRCCRTINRYSFFLTMKMSNDSKCKNRFQINSIELFEFLFLFYFSFFFSCKCVYFFIFWLSEVTLTAVALWTDPFLCVALTFFVCRLPIFFFVRKFLVCRNEFSSRLISVFTSIRQFPNWFQCEFPLFSLQL